MAKQSKNSTSGVESGNLTLYIFIAILSAIAVALLFPQFATHLKIGGEIFLRLLKMMVVPLVMTSVMSGVLGMGDVRKLGRPGLLTIGYFLTTTIAAVLIGLVIVNVLQPGVGSVDPETIAAMRETGSVSALLKSKGADLESSGVGQILENLVLMLFTDNLLASATGTKLLPLIVFSIFFAGLLTTMGKRVETLTSVITQANEAMLSFIMMLMKIAPIGIFCLVAARFGAAQADGKLFEVLRQTGWYFVSVVLGLGIHLLVVLPSLYWFVTRKNPFQYMYQVSQALLTAFSTASSSATLPVTMECVTLKAGVSRESTEFVVPLGATINMDGTALYEAAAALFIAQCLGIELGIGQQLIVAATATLAAIGAAGIPEAGLVTMIIVLNAVGLPIEYMGLILSVDWLLDRFRTAVNVAGDCIGAAVVDKSMLAAKKA